MDDDDDILPVETDPKTLAIFDQKVPGEHVPEGFSSFTVHVDLKPDSLLDFQIAKSHADAGIMQGLKVCFELDLGLFEKGFNQVQYQSHLLALDEFRKNLLTPLWAHTAALILYRSRTAFATTAERDIQMDYLDLLRLDLPDDIPVLLLFSCKSIRDKSLFARLFSPERYSRFVLALEDAPVLLTACCYNSGKALLGYIGRDIAHYTPSECTVGIVLPCQNIEAAFSLQNDSFKIVSEELLATEWEGLDRLITQKECLAPTTIRLLEGFQAAGGAVDYIS